MKDETAQHVRNRLISIMSRAELPQSDIAKAIGCSPQHLCDVLKGRREPFGAILEYLGLERIVLYRKKP